ncbi:MAG: hypothetical protein AB7O31_16635 [Burkholderiales bacterium]
MSTDQSSVAQELEPVVLELGKALFICQCFEGTLIMLLSTISYEEADMEEGSFTAAIELFSQKTLGQLLRRLKERIDPPAELTDCFISGWNSRNWIVHHFLHSTVHELSSPKGRLQAIEKLVAAKQTVKRADIVANRVLDMYLKKYGMSVAALKANADRVWDHMNPQRSPTSS